MEKDELIANFATINDSLAKLNLSLTNIDARVAAVESSSQSNLGIGQADPHSAVHQAQFPRGGASAPGSSVSNSTGATYDIAHEFKLLQDNYLRTSLPPESKLHIERTGFRGEEARKLTIVSNCAKYSETILKILAAAPGETLTKEQVAEIAVCATAQQTYLQGAYANLVVHSSFDGQTAKLFSQLQRNTSAFPPTLLPTLQSAAAISASAHHQQQGNQAYRGNGRSFNNNKGFNRGSGYRGNNYNPNYNNRGGNYRGGNRGGYPYQFDNSFPVARPENNPDDHP